MFSHGGESMKTIASAVLVLGMMGGAVGLSAQTEEPKKATHENVRVVTGCVARDGDEYKVTAKDGSSWEIKSDAIAIAKHVGHTVTVTGAVDNPGLHGVKEDTKTTFDKDAKEHGHMTVTKLKMDSDSCK
jgi:hypothetical protein